MIDNILKLLTSSNLDDVLLGLELAYHNEKEWLMANIPLWDINEDRPTPKTHSKFCHKISGIQLGFYELEEISVYLYAVNGGNFSGKFTRMTTEYARKDHHTLKRLNGKSC